MLTNLLAKRLLRFSKICSSAQEAISGIKHGSFLLVGGFGLCGVPMNLIHAVKQSGVSSLTVASNNCGIGDEKGLEDWGLSVLLRTKQIKRMISSYVGENAQFERQYFNGELELEICPQGTLAEKIRCGGAGIPAFYTATGVDTYIQEGRCPIKYQEGAKNEKIKIVEIPSEPKPSMYFNGKKYILQKSIKGDYALIKAKKADKMGNLIFDKTERNFNADMATAASCVIVEVEEIVQIGQLDPDQVHIPAVFVDRIFKSDPKSPWSEKLIEKLTVADHPTVKKNVKYSQIKQVVYPSNEFSKSKDEDNIRLKIARRAAKEVRNGMNVNLGIGIPTLLPGVLSPDVKINLQSENGMMGVGPYPPLLSADPNNINAGKQTISTLPGGSYFSSSQSFSIIRGGHLDVTMLGALEISMHCDIANWIIPDKMMKGMGGAMDLVACGSKVIVLMEHAAKNKKTGAISMKLLDQCRLPLTARGVVSMLITQLAVFENQRGMLVLTELAEGISLDEVQILTGFKIMCADNIGRF